MNPTELHALFEAGEGDGGDLVGDDFGDEVAGANVDAVGVGDDVVCSATVVGVDEFVRIFGDDQLFGEHGLAGAILIVDDHRVGIELGRVDHFFCGEGMFFAQEDVGGDGAERVEGDLPFVEDLGDESFVVWGEADDAEGAFFEMDVFDGVEGLGFFQAIGVA